MTLNETFLEFLKHMQRLKAYEKEKEQLLPKSNVVEITTKQNSSNENTIDSNDTIDS